MPMKAQAAIKIRLQDVITGQVALPVSAKHFSCDTEKKTKPGIQLPRRSARDGSEIGDGVLSLHSVQQDDGEIEVFDVEGRRLLASWPVHERTCLFELADGKKRDGSVSYADDGSLYHSLGDLLLNVEKWRRRIIIASDVRLPDGKAMPPGAELIVASDPRFDFFGSPPPASVPCWLLHSGADEKRPTAVSIPWDLPMICAPCETACRIQPLVDLRDVLSSMPLKAILYPVLPEWQAKESTEEEEGQDGFSEVGRSVLIRLRTLVVATSLSRGVHSLWFPPTSTEDDQLQLVEDESGRFLRRACRLLAERLDAQDLNTWSVFEGRKLSATDLNRDQLDIRARMSVRTDTSGNVAHSIWKPLRKRPNSRGDAGVVNSTRRPACDMRRAHSSPSRYALRKGEAGPAGGRETRGLARSASWQTVELTQTTTRHEASVPSLLSETRTTSPPASEESSSNKEPRRSISSRSSKHTTAVFTRSLLDATWHGQPLESVGEHLTSNSPHFGRQEAVSDLYTDMRCRCMHDGAGEHKTVTQRKCMPEPVKHYDRASIISPLLRVQSCTNLSSNGMGVLQRTVRRARSTRAPTNARSSGFIIPPYSKTYIELVMRRYLEDRAPAVGVNQELAFETAKSEGWGEDDSQLQHGLVGYLQPVDSLSWKRHGQSPTDDEGHKYAILEPDLSVDHLDGRLQSHH